jgi:aminocarboxymuconate-semialdehyde decarboxylase
MLGSDFPYPLGERPVGRVLDEADFLDDDDWKRIRRGNALRFLGLDDQGSRR